jgi:hypothetical protein
MATTTAASSAITSGMRDREQMCISQKTLSHPFRHEAEREMHRGAQIVGSPNTVPLWNSCSVFDVLIAVIQRIWDRAIRIPQSAHHHV